MEQMLPQGPNTSHCSHPHDILSIHHYLMKDYYYYWHSGECVSCWVMSTLCDSMDWGLPCSSVDEISQARMQQWVAISFSRESSWPRDQTTSFALTGRFFTTEPPGKPQNIGIRPKTLMSSIKDINHAVGTMLTSLSWESYSRLQIQS